MILFNKKRPKKTQVVLHETLMCGSLVGRWLQLVYVAYTVEALLEQKGSMLHTAWITIT